ncbi:MAG: LysR family transcriptional regulator [Bradyrhizobium sp.]|nr:LysR family transcriptional regulator [Bradyrhizobium sp.]
MDSKLEARRLRYFIQVVESGSVRGAAGALGMDASAVSRAVGLLEQECGTQLLERKGRGVAPTDAGHLLAHYLRRQQTEKQNLLAEIDSIRKVEKGHVDIIAGEGYVDWLMQKCMCRFMHAHPGITTDLDVGSTDQIVQSIIEERAHIGILFRPPRDERLRSHYSRSHPIKAWVLRTHPLARIGRSLRLLDLVPYPGAAVGRTFGVRQHIEAAEISEGIRLNIAFTAASFDAISHFVTAGLGYTLATNLATAPANAGRVVALPMKNALLHRGRTHVVTRQGRTLPPAAAELLRIVLKEMESLGG